MTMTLEWKLNVSPDETVVCLTSPRVVALFEGDEENPPSEPTEIVDAAVRTVACVSALQGVENPAHQVRTWRADAGYLGQYRDAYCGAVLRNDRLREHLRLLRAEVLAMRAVVGVGDTADMGPVILPIADLSREESRARRGALLLATQRVTQSGVLEADIDAPARPDIGRFADLDVLAVQRLIEAIERIATPEYVPDIETLQSLALKCLRVG